MSGDNARCACVSTDRPTDRPTDARVPSADANAARDAAAHAARTPAALLSVVDFNNNNNNSNNDDDDDDDDDDDSDNVFDATNINYDNCNNDDDNNAGCAARDCHANALVVAGLGAGAHVDVVANGLVVNTVDEQR